jgi:hypothetical protein
MLTAPPVNSSPYTEVPHDERYEIVLGYMKVVYKLGKAAGVTTPESRASSRYR